MKKRFSVIKLLHRDDAWSVEDEFTGKTKAVFYDEAAEDLAGEFCRHVNKALDLAEDGQ